MDYLQARPHTVAAMSRSNTHSECILKILEDIENEATSLPAKPKVQEKNHLKENFKRLKEIQIRAKQKATGKQPLQPIKALNKYSQVPAKVSSTFNASCTKENFPRRSKEEIGLPRTAGPYRTQPPLSPCLSSKSDNHRSLNQYKSLPQLNHISETEKVSNYLSNSRSSHKDEKLLSSQKSPEPVFSKSREKAETKHRLGQIPSYLTERKKQWDLERERQLKLLEEANIPPGHTLLPDEERIETLELLKKNQEELLQSLASLPVRNDTLRLQHYKEDLEKQLAKVEEGIKIFSRPKVLIKNDA